MRNFNLSRPLAVAILFFGAAVSVPTLTCAQTPAGFLGMRDVVSLQLGYLPSLTRDNNLNPGPSIGLAYHHVTRYNRAVGLVGGFRSYRKPTYEGVEAAKATTELKLAVELESYGSKRFGRMAAPIGPSLVYGLGVRRFNGIAPPAYDRGAAPGEATSLTSVFLRLGFNSRYVIKEKFVITPWARFDVVLPFNGEFGALLNDDPTIIPDSRFLNILQGGLNFGMMF